MIREIVQKIKDIFTQRSWLFRAAVVFVVLIIVGVSVSFAVRSPNENAIRNSQTVPVITAKVEMHNFVKPAAEAQGSISVGSSYEVTVPAGNSNPVVTSVDVHPGDTIKSGTLLGRVSGRPLIALNLPFSLYRTIQAGDKGDDVRALQAALKEIGFYYGNVDGYYGARTADAVRRLYGRLGVTAPETPETDAEPAEEGEEAKPAPKPLTPVPAAEFVAISGTASVAEVAAVGTTLGETQPFAKLRVGSTAAKARVSVADADAFVAGVKVQVFDVTSGQMLSEGIVESVSEFKAADSESEAAVPGYDITVKLDKTDGLSDGQRVQVKTSEVGTSTKALAVPVTALREQAGKSYVITKDGTEIPVTVELVLDGYAQIDGDLTEGTEVIISTTGK